MTEHSYTVRKTSRGSSKYWCSIKTMTLLGPVIGAHNGMCRREPVFGSGLDWHRAPGRSWPRRAGN